MAVNTHDPVFVQNTNATSQLPTPARGLNATVSHSLDRRAIAGDQIHSNMRPVPMQNRMVAIRGKAGGNIFKIQRVPQSLNAQCVPTGIVKTRTAILVSKGHRSEGF